MQTFRNSISCLLIAGLIITFCSIVEAQDSSLQESLILRFRFEGTGNTAGDASGNGNDGTIVGAQRTAGRYGKGLAIGQQDEYVQISNVLTPAGTVEFWFKPNWDGTASGTYRLFDANTGAIYYIIGKGKAVGDREDTFGFYLEDASDADFQDWETPAPDAIPAAGEWYHLTTTWDFPAGEARFYINGEEVGNVTGLGNFPPLNANPRIGSNAHASYMTAANGADGVIDEFSIYSKVLTVEEIQVVMRGVGDYPWAYGPDPKDGTLIDATWVNLSWSAGDFAASHDVYLGDNFDDVNDATVDSPVFRGNLGDTFAIAGFFGFPYPDGLVPGTTYYWRIDEVNDTEPNSPWKGKTWSFSVPPNTAYDPVPAEGTMFVPVDVTLEWTPGFNAKLHTVYIDEDFNTVANATGGAPQGAATFTPSDLALETTYYWRVDEFDPPTTHKGDVWSFTTTLPGLGTAVMDRWENITTTDINALKNDARYPNNPDVTEMVDQFLWNGADLSDYGARIEAWLYAPATGDYTFWLNTDDQGELLLSTDDDSSNAVLIARESSWSGFGAWGTGEEQSDPIPLVAGEKYYIMAIWKEGGGGDHCQVGWQGPGIPERTVIPGANLSPFEPMSAYGAKPANRAVGVAQTPILQWKPGLAAASHEVYFGTDADAVANATKASPEYAGTRQLGAESYEPAMLAWDANYYWRVDEVNAVNPDSPWLGKVWSFTTADFGIVEDFESYNDIPAGDPGSNLVYVKWKDGFDNPNVNGSTIGYVTGASMESAEVHGGLLSAPMAYNNTTAGLSEVERNFSPAQDWTANGETVLSLWFFGDPANVPGQLYVKINGVQVNYDGAAANLGRPLWQVWNIDLTTVGTNLQSVRSLAIGIQGPGATGTLLLDDIELHRSVPAAPVQVYLEAESGTLGASWRLTNDPASSGGRNIGSNDGDGDDNDTAPGPEWTAVYNFNAPVEGVYKVVLRVQENGSDSFWVRIPGAASQTHEDPDQPGTGWVRFNGIDAPDGWAWDEVHSNDHNNAVVNWTLPAGALTLEIAKREDGVLLDAILITSDVD